MFLFIRRENEASVATLVLRDRKETVVHRVQKVCRVHLDHWVKR